MGEGHRSDPGIGLTRGLAAPAKAGLQFAEATGCSEVEGENRDEPPRLFQFGEMFLNSARRRGTRAQLGGDESGDGTFSPVSSHALSDLGMAVELGDDDVGIQEEQSIRTSRLL
jgi:hypothetical protein